MSVHFWFTLLILFSASQKPGPSSIKHLDFLQLSQDRSGNDSEGMEDQTKIATVFLLNIIGCIVVCLGLQVVIILSKKMNQEMITLRKNYLHYLEFKKFTNLKRSLTREKEALINNSAEEKHDLDEYDLKIKSEGSK
jgi:hypothetical protein